MHKIWPLLFILSIGACGGRNRTGESKPLPPLRSDVRVEIKDRDRTVAVFEAQTAADAYSRQTGLMYRKKLDSDRGMLFIFPAPQRAYFHMKNTLIPLDVIFIGPDSTILWIKENARPLDETPFGPEAPVQFVLEFKGGTAAAKGIKEGMKVQWQ
ncbi:MAG: DUF192 domain-containing protein [Chlorobi bacterium]|nr:DUF192 domain-containing protein [Chlorobiota bacterium]